ncbi:DsrE family protein [Anaeromyxobacter oryzisoli]|uniref:DsrE family protein n=1 Tax=Anaeromyxobacter oryzisoli TaxID=2925408 RepID=UPI001F56C364|nr:DsrE family protein [Anaeromyxobacter sp. SG63]
MSFTKKELSHLVLAVAVALATLAAPAARAAPPARAAAYGNADALRGVKTGKAVFLVDLGDAKKLAMYLKLLAGTRENLVRQGVAADFKVVIIGPSVRFLSTVPPAQATPEELAALPEIARAVHALKVQGDALEVCAIATQVFKVDDATLLPELKVVADGFISLIGYQAQGYHLVPIF